jgi:hypothetical protein
MSHRHRILAGAAGAMALTLLIACPSPGSAPAPSSEPQKCTRVGQTCEFSPNKLGSCVLRDNCSQDCLVCQSQH